MPFQAFDSAGFQGPVTRFLVYSVDARLVFYGLMIEPEWLRSQLTDSLTARPVSHASWNVTTAFTLHFNWPIALEPLFRYGENSLNETVAPTKTTWIEGGITVYPAPTEGDLGKLKVSALYFFQDRVTERERAHGARLFVQLTF